MTEHNYCRLVRWIGRVLHTERYFLIQESLVVGLGILLFYLWGMFSVFLFGTISIIVNDEFANMAFFPFINLFSFIYIIGICYFIVLFTAGSFKVRIGNIFLFLLSFVLTFTVTLICFLLIVDFY